LHKRKRDDDNDDDELSAPDVPSFPVLTNKKRRVGSIDADIVASDAVADALRDNEGARGNLNADIEDDEDGAEQQTFMLPGDELSSEDEQDELDDQDKQDASADTHDCPCCELATSEVVRAMNSVADTLAGRAGDGHITKMQLEIYDRRMAPLRREGRQVPLLTREMLLRHYRTHRVSIMRSVAEEIRVFELMERTLRRTGLCDVDADGRRVLVKSGAQEMNRLSKSKLDLLKFYSTLEKQRREDEANAGSK
jgi:hypothetical protein